MNQSSLFLAIQNPAEFSRDIGIVHANGHIVFLTDSERRKVHDIQFLFVAFIESDGIVLGGGGIFFGVGGINPIDAGAFEDDVSLDLHGTEGAACVGGEEGVAGAGTHDDDMALLEQADGLGGAHGVGDAVDVKA